MRRPTDLRPCLLGATCAVLVATILLVGRPADQQTSRPADQQTSIVVPPPSPSQAPAVKTAEPAPAPEATPVASSAPAGRMAPAPAGTAPDDDPSAIEAYIWEVFGPQHGRKALCVAALESTGDRGRYNVNARGKLGEASLFQIRPHLHSWRLAEVGGTSLWNWRDNVRVAKHLFDARSWRPWSVRGRC